jgi:siroheme synthase (precorrin-2 oxidase/ferrochelatase)
MVDGHHGVNGVHVRRHVANHFDQEVEHVQILNRRIMEDYVLDRKERKKHVRRLLVPENQHV